MVSYTGSYTRYTGQSESRIVCCQLVRGNSESLVMSCVCVHVLSKRVYVSYTNWQTGAQ